MTDAIKDANKEVNGTTRRGGMGNGHQRKRGTNEAASEQKQAANQGPKQPARAN